MRSIVRLIACLALCYGIAGIGAVYTADAIPTWYKALAKPSWTPPNYVFPIAWNILYAMISVSLWLLWDKTAEGRERSSAIKLFLLQLLLNGIWTPVFFGAHLVWPALAIMLGLWVALVLTIKAAWPINRPAALLLVPYLLWITYAATLNAGIGVLNRG